MQVSAEFIAKALDGRRSGAGWIAKCPAHKDKTPSLTLTDKGGKLLVHCFAGCSQADVVRALQDRGLWPKPEITRTPEETAQLKSEWYEIQKALPEARLWRRVAIELTEEVLADQKIKRFDPQVPFEQKATIGELRSLTLLLQRLKTATDSSLVTEYRDWLRECPAFCAVMVRWSRNRQLAERRALRRFLRESR